MRTNVEDNRQRGIRDRLKLIAAALVVVFAATVAFGISVSVLPPNSRWGGIITICVLVVAAAAAVRALNGPLVLSKHSYVEAVRRLEEQDVLTSERYRACRALEVQELEDEGLHFYLQLEDRRVLFLSGQYLYDYRRTGRFPCTDFVIRRHKVDQFAVDIRCEGNFIQPEVIAPPFELSAFRSGAVPDDGEIVANQDYENIKASLVHGNRPKV